MILTNYKKGWPVNDKLFIVGKKDIALRLGCSKQQVVKYIRHEGLPVIQDKPGSWYRITREALEKWCQEYQKRKQLKNTL